MRAIALAFVVAATASAVVTACGSFGEDTSGADAGTEGGAGGETGPGTEGGTPPCDGNSKPECVDQVCSGGVCALAASCKELHAKRPELATGVHYIDADGAGSIGPAKVWCDMTTDGGGWMLVARSVAGVALAADFGWRDDHGDLTDDSEPFSLETKQIGVTFTEILFGARGEGKAWDVPVYKYAVPVDFVANHTDSLFEPAGGAVTVFGQCKPPGGPVMVQKVGFTKLGNHFSFTDAVATPNFGFYSDGWDTNGANATDANRCPYTGNLTGKQGMIFVR